MAYLDSNGNYYEGDKVAFDDIEVTERPSFLHQWVDGEWVIDQVTLKEKLVTNIDDLVAAIYQTLTRFQAEYELRESEAQAFKDDGYTGDVPRQVAAFADRAGVPAQQATDSILSQAAGLRAALANLGDLRMRKYEVINASDAENAQNLFNEIKDLIEAEAKNII